MGIKGNEGVKGRQGYSGRSGSVVRVKWHIYLVDSKPSRSS